MSSLEMLTLLELAEGNPAARAGRSEQAPPAFRLAFRRLAAFGQRSLLLLALLAIWEAVPRLGLTDPAFLPPFSQVVSAGWQLAQNGELYDDVGAGAERISDIRRVDRPARARDRLVRPPR
jgi:NitT/TauT family transport system permease protein